MIRFSKQKFEELKAELEKSYPCEGCGLLGGKDGVVLTVYPLRNISDTPETFFTFDPKDQISVIKQMRNAGEDFLGIFHSHVDCEPYPSERDVKYAFYSNVSYVIARVDGGRFSLARSFLIREGKIEEEEVVIDP